MAETSKKRTVRIPLDYYKRPDQFSKWKMFLCAAAVLVAGGWASGFGWDFWSASRWQARSRGLASHGPLARAHATWDSQCNACHAPFRPIGQATWVAPILGDSSKSDGQCQRCHSAPIHHQSQSPHDLACASCHHDHRGRDASLVRLADQHCTRCHSDLTAHLKEDRPPNVDATVTRFDTNMDHHPEFRSVHNTDPGRIEFSHARHLRLGMASDKGGPVQTLQMLRKPDRARFRRYAQGTEGFIQLDCAACHTLDQQDSGASALSGTTPSSGAYMLPMTYENQCRACHLLEYPSGTPGSLLAHGLQPAEVHSSLWQTFGAEFLNENPALLDQPIPPRPMPGKVEPSEIPKARQVIAGRVEKAETILFGEKKCAECHRYEDGNKNPVPVLKRWDPAHEVRITPPDIQTVWWRSAAFEHSAHRGVSCRGCHEAAYPDSPRASHRSKDVLLPSKEVCLECHAPRRNGSDAKTVSGGAGFDCTECHRYHNGDAALGGLITSPGAADVRSPIRQFLIGAPAATRP